MSNFNIEQEAIVGKKSTIKIFDKKVREFIKLCKRVLSKTSAKFGGTIVILLIIIALFPGFFATHNPMEMDSMQRLTPPSAENWFGTDEFGRDIYSRVIYGAQITLRIGLISVGLALSVGGILGLMAGYYRGKIDIIISAAMDILLTFPSFILALVIIAVLGPSLTNTMIAVGIGSIPVFTRVIRSATMSIREQDYIMAAKAAGASDFKILFSHIVPNVLSSVIVLITLEFPAAVLMAAGLSFLGLGAQPPMPEWGAMLVGARVYITEAVWVVNFPGFAILLTVLGFNLLGNSLRDVLDPKLKGSS